MTTHTTMREVEAMIVKHKQLLQEIVISMVSTEETAMALETNLETGKVEEMEETMKVYVDLERRLKDRVTALEDLKTTVQRAPKVDELDMSSALSKKIKEIEKSEGQSLKKNKRYTEFKKKIWLINHPDEPMQDEENEGLMVMSSAGENTICPITRKDFEEPVKNPVCGHVYTKEAIIQVIRTKRGRSVTCPVAGCRAPVNEKSLEPDVEMERKLKKLKKQKEIKQSQPSPPREEEEEEEYTQL